MQGHRPIAGDGFCSGLPVLALLLFGGETLKAFAFALLVGTISGTYSSVFIAGPVLTAWKEREPVYRRRRASIAAENDGIVPAYATAGAAVDVAPKQRARRRDRLTAPDDPEQGVSREEFEEIVRDLHVEPVRRRAATAVAEPKPKAQPKPKPRRSRDRSVGRRAARGRRSARPAGRRRRRKPKRQLRGRQAPQQAREAR